MEEHSPPPTMTLPMVIESSERNRGEYKEATAEITFIIK